MLSYSWSYMLIISLSCSLSTFYILVFHVNDNFVLTCFGFWHFQVCCKMFFPFLLFSDMSAYTIVMTILNEFLFCFTRITCICLYPQNTLLLSLSNISLTPFSFLSPFAYDSLIAYKDPIVFF